MKGSTPKGLNITLQPSVPCADTELLIQWEKLKLDYQSKIILSLSQYWKRYKDKLIIEQLKLQDQLKANSIEEEWNRMAQILEKVEISAKDRYNNKKKNPNSTKGKPENSSKDRSGRERNKKPSSRQPNK
jgi:hypothetical protein